MDTAADLPRTRAMTHLAESRAALECDIVTARQTIHAEIRQQSDTELKATLARIGGVRGKSRRSRDETIHTIVARRVEDTPQWAALRDAQMAAHADQHSDDRAAGLITDAADLAAETAEKASAGIHELRLHTAWRVEKIMAASHAAVYAASWMKGRREGGEPSDLGRRLGRLALSAIVATAGSPSNLKMDGHGMDRVGEAVGARMFLQAVAMSLPADYIGII